MIRRGWLAVAVAFVLGPMIPGCGMAVRKLDEESLAAATTAVRGFEPPPHRVALATFEAMRAELASSDFAKNSEFSKIRPPVRKDGTPPKRGELPPDFPAFWLEWNGAGKPVRELVGLRAAHFAGKANDGRPIEVNVTAKDGETLVTIRVDQLGDRMFCTYLFEQISGHLNHPSYPPGSVEEAAALQAFFGGVESREALPSLRRAAGQPPASSGAIEPLSTAATRPR